MQKIQYITRISYSVASILLLAPIVKHFLSKNPILFEEYDREYVQLHVKLGYKQYIFVFFLLSCWYLGFHFENAFFAFISKIGSILRLLMTMLYIFVIFTYADMNVLSRFYTFSFTYFLWSKAKKYMTFFVKKLYEYFGNIRY